MDEQRERILQETEIRIKRYGYKGLNLDELARELGVSKKTLYQHFGDKKSLATESVKQMLHREECIFNDIYELRKSTLNMMLSISQHIRKMIRGINPVAFQEMKRFLPEAWEMFVQHRESHMHDMLVECLKRGVQEGVFRDDFDIEVIVKMRMHQIEMAFDPEIFPQERFEPGHVQQEFFIHFFNGIATTKGVEQFKTLMAEAETQ